MSILAWIVVGLIAGWLAGKVARGSGYGVIGDIILGIIGALLGGLLATNVIGMGVLVSSINLTTLIVAFPGAVVMVVLTRLLGGRRRIA